MPITMQLEIILEKNGSDLWGRIDSPPYLYLTTVGNSVEGVTANLRDLIADFLEHEGKDLDEWKAVNPDAITFEYSYDLTAFFEVFNELNISAVAKTAGINSSLMRQYASGAKHPSDKQVQKIQTAVHQIAQNLMRASLV